MNPDLLKKLEASLQAKFPVRRHDCIKEETKLPKASKEIRKAYDKILRQGKRRDI